MTIRTAAIAVTAITLAIGAYIALVPSPDSTTHAGNPTATPPALAASALPDGLTGRLTYRTGAELVTVQFPEANEVGREPATFSDGDLVSADGLWRVHDATLLGPSGEAIALAGEPNLEWSRDVQWSPAGHTLAIRTWDDAGTTARLEFIDDPVTGRRHTVTSNVNAFAWTADGGVLVSENSAGYPLIRFAPDGTAAVVSPKAGPIRFFYPSPDLTRFAYTTDAIDGWHVALYDDTTRVIGDLGPMGAGGTVPQGAPDVKTPMYIAWSPDGARLAFGGGFEPPYTMTVIDVASGDVARTTFPSGYPGEIRWTLDSTRIAVSTYDIERTHHETWVVDTATGDGRFLMNGCVIVWSPDGRFLAVHGETEPGINIIDVDTGARGRFTHSASDVPIAWK